MSDEGGRAGAEVWRRSRIDSLASGLSVITGRSRWGYVRAGLIVRSVSLCSASLPVAGSVRSEGMRAGRIGRSTAPVGRLSEVAGVTSSEEMTVLGSRPLSMRVRRRSLSSETPGIRAAAPVGRSFISTLGLTRAGLDVTNRPPSIEAPSVDAALTTRAGLKGRSPRKGSVLKARLANA